jgi:chaperone modulatory protein CbpM
MMRAHELVAEIAALDPVDLDVWVREALIRPEPDADGPLFSERECARVRLLCTLRYELEVEVDSLPLILSLLDQLYETRGQLAALSAAVLAQEEDVRRDILDAVGDIGRKG